MRRRGFVLPIVILLALVVGILAAVMLERQSAQSLSVQHSLAGYRNHHFSRGVREVVGAWTTTLGGQPLASMIQEDGHILDIEAADGTYLSIFMFDGQGSALSEPAGLNEEEKLDAFGVLEQLGIITGGNPEGGLLRPVGPVKICVTSAPPELLEALANYANGGGRNGRRYAETIIKAREAAALTQTDVETAMGAADMTPEARQIMARLAVLTPELWNMVIDVYPSGAREPATRYGGRFIPPGSGSSSRTGSTLQSLGNFLSWEELPIHETPTP